MFQVYDERQTYDRVIQMDCDFCGKECIARTPVEHLTEIYVPHLAFYAEWARATLGWIIAAENQIWCRSCWERKKRAS